MLTPAFHVLTEAPVVSNEKKTATDRSAGPSWKREMERAQAELWLRQRALPEGMPRGESDSQASREPDAGTQHERNASAAPFRRPPEVAVLHAASPPVSEAESRVDEPDGRALPGDRAARALDGGGTFSPAVPALTPSTQAGLPPSVEAGQPDECAQPATGTVMPTGLAGYLPRTAGPGNPDLLQSERPLLPAGPLAAPRATPPVALASEGQPHPAIVTPSSSWLPALAIGTQLQAAVRVAPDELAARPPSLTDARVAGPDQPLRVVAAVQGTDVCIWLGMDAGVELNLEALLTRFRPILERHGLRLAKVICNGTTVFEAPSPNPPTSNTGNHRS